MFRGGARAAADEGAGGALLFGFPLRATIVLVGVAVVPILILPFAWALTFDSSMLSEEDLRKLREAQAAMARSGDGGSRPETRSDRRSCRRRCRA